MTGVNTSKISPPFVCGFPQAICYCTTVGSALFHSSQQTELSQRGFTTSSDTRFLGCSASAWHPEKCASEVLTRLRRGFVMYSNVFVQLWERTSHCRKCPKCVTFCQKSPRCPSTSSARLRKRLHQITVKLADCHHGLSLIGNI